MGRPRTTSGRSATRGHAGPRHDPTTLTRLADGHNRADAGPAGLPRCRGRGGCGVVDRAQARDPPKTPRRLAGGPQPVGSRGGKAFAYEEPRPRRGDEAARPVNSRVLRGARRGEAGTSEGCNDRRGQKGRPEGGAEEGSTDGCKRGQSKLNEIAARQRDAQPPEEPVLKRYKTEDATVEKISEILLENPRGILVHRDELSGWLRNLDKQGREGDRSFYLEAWNGTGSFDVDRISRGSLHVPALCLSILGSIQPGPLSTYVYQATKGEKGDDGLLQRFQLLVWPDPHPTWRNVDRWPDIEAKNRAYEVFRRLDALNPEDLGV